jgi:hypothetical protein
MWRCVGGERRVIDLKICLEHSMQIKILCASNISTLVVAPAMNNFFSYLKIRHLKEH